MYPGQPGTATGQADGAGADGTYAGHTGVADGLIGQFTGGCACADGASNSAQGDAAPKIAAAQAPPKRILR
jgi:hypothetical protein